ncbi:MAG: hypothetical protein FIA91_07200 [Geobacter sp.]|nr:hypothetical protein [Geobacter sp.]
MGNSCSSHPVNRLNLYLLGVMILALLAISVAIAAPKPSAHQKIKESGGHLSAEYGFLNFNSDQLSLNFSIPVRELAAYRHEYGYTAAERAAIDQWQKRAIEEAYQTAVRNRQGQEELNRAGEKISAEYRSRLNNFFRSRGFKLSDGNVLMADIPEIVQRNVKRVKPVALSLNSAAEKLGYDSDSIIAAALSFIQTAVQYENVPLTVKGRQTGGVYPPLETLALGKGDCDTKAALLASILLNWNRIKIVGVGVPNHYLMGVLRNPAKGDAFVEYRGARYVLMEPAGPGWLPPGTVDRKTLSLLNAADNVRIEPFSAN